MLATLFVCLVTFGANYVSPMQPKETIIGATFSGVFSSNAVLQREPYYATLYGTSDTPNADITFIIKQEDGNYQQTLKTKSNSKTNDWKIKLNKEMPNGGNYTLSVQCTTCKVNNTIINYLYNITFGDVFFCSGQSNMLVSMHYSFNRNNTYKAISNKDNKYKNIRYFFQALSQSDQVIYVTPAVRPGHGGWNLEPSSSSLDGYSSVCWYFAQSLIDSYGNDLSDIKIGLIESAFGGTMIEQWIENNTVQHECSGTICPNHKCGQNYNSMVAPFINMTIKSILWYQGEANVYELGGNYINNTGYGCMQPFLINQWRNKWGYDMPFGLVVLPAGTSEEGPNSPHMPNFRWSQLANFDYLSNKAMGNTFAALAYDLGDPWNQNCEYVKNKGDHECVCCGDAPYSVNKTTWYFGPIHPRCKLQVGQRLAKAGYDIIYRDQQNNNNQMNIGPLLSGCSLDNDTQKLLIAFNSTFMNKDDKILIYKFQAWYNKSINYKTVQNWTAMEIEIDNEWYFVDNIEEGNKSNIIQVDLSTQFNQSMINKISGLRYAYIDWSCCGSLNRTLNPCPPNSCPVQMGSNFTNTLPAVPFNAQIVNGTCQCYAPQTCDEFRV